MRASLFIIFFGFILNTNPIHTQTFSGNVRNAVTNQPIESASVYFDNTTIGTTTNFEGEFTIEYTNAIQSSLIISFLGFETKTILDYRENNNRTILLKPKNNILDEVIINTDDGLTRKQKLKLFREQFLGFSNFAKSCEILNENDLILKYNKKEKLLTADAYASIIIENKSLQYIITFDIQHFEIKFRYVDEKKGHFNISSVGYSGNSFYKDFKNLNKEKAKRNRDKAYRGSTLEFMRALYNKELEKSKYHIYYKSFKRNPWEYFKVEAIKNSSLKKITLDKPVSILYKKKHQSKVQFIDPSIIVDVYGNYSEITNVLFSGYMGNQRIGDSVPLDYNL